MKTYLKLVVLLFVANTGMAASPDAAAPTALQAGSGWTNQSGSTLYIDAVDPTGRITGHYINRAAGYSCQNISYPVTGWVYGTALTFTTIWESTTESCNSITAWTGFLNAQGQIATLWQLVISGSTSTSQIIQGNDVFTYSSKVNKKSLLKAK